MDSTRRIPLSHRILWISTALLVLVTGPSSVEAQIRAPAPQPADPIGAIVGGALGGSLGLVGGAFVGVAMACGASSCTGEYAGYGAALLGLLIGEVLLLPVGVHIGNGSKGNLAKDVGVSAGTAAAAIILGSMTESYAIFALAVAAHFGLTVRAERTAGARSGRGLTIEAHRFANGRTGVGLAIAYRGGAGR
jgi:hypothetical protein